MKCYDCQKREGKYLIDFGDGISRKLCFICSLGFDFDAGLRMMSQQPRRREAIEHTRRKLGL